ncbi:MAG TPA: flagellar basal body L-ring protein FlgH [Gammaproteobacteria bacterium]|nr:flagellar basal body L-ring protein FlgH [Gammaproteobacteria bacterium]
MNKRAVWRLIFWSCLVLNEPVVAASLYDETQYRPLTSDHRAYSPGDSLTILIYESASSSTTAGVDANKSLDVSAAGRFNDNGQDAALGFSNESDGGGTISRTGRLVASVSVTVESVLPNGELAVKGEQSIEFNEESQFITVEGRVRPQDINEDNTVLSTRVADAKIRYVGDGLLGSRQKPGFITNFFNWLF